MSKNPVFILRVRILKFYREASSKLAYNIALHSPTRNLHD